MHWQILFAAFTATAMSVPVAATNMRWPGWTDPILVAAYKNAWANDCEIKRKPVVRRRDINGDGQAEAIVRDTSACYQKVGGHYSLVSQVAGKWERIGYWNGTARLLRSRSGGWPDLEVPDFTRQGRCHMVYRFRGGHYYHDYLAETAPHQCRTWTAKRGGATSLAPVPPKPR
jgi:hypothetical protein